MIVSEAGVDIVDSSLVLSVGFLVDLVIGKDSTVYGKDRGGNRQSDYGERPRDG
jgi:hypothetical protein